MKLSDWQSILNISNQINIDPRQPYLLDRTHWFPGASDSVKFLTGVSRDWHIALWSCVIQTENIELRISCTKGETRLLFDPIIPCIWSRSSNAWRTPNVKELANSNDFKTLPDIIQQVILRRLSYFLIFEEKNYEN